MNTLQEFKFKRIYELTDLVDGHVKAGEELWNYNEEYFIEAATRFSKHTLLHLYIVTTAINGFVAWLYWHPFDSLGHAQSGESV